MEHMDVIVKIIEAEKAARQVADEALAKKEHLGENLAEEKTRLHDKYMERARRRIDIVREQENRDAQENIEHLAQELEQNKAQLTSRFKENKEAWINELLTYVTRSDVSD